jgi:putative acetyltransferase
MEIREGGLDDMRVRGLLERHFAGMLANSPKDSTHFLDFSGLAAPDVTFWTVWDGEDLLGCGALRGTGAKLVGHILSTARSRGYRRVSLETGSGDAFDAAHALYRQFGFTECGPFGDYREDPFSRFLSRVV